MLSLVCSMDVVDKLSFVLRLARRPPTWKMAVHMAAVDDVLSGDKFCVVFPHNCLEWDQGLNCASF